MNMILSPENTKAIKATHSIKSSVYSCNVPPSSSKDATDSDDSPIIRKKSTAKAHRSNPLDVSESSILETDESPVVLQKAQPIYPNPNRAENSSTTDSSKGSSISFKGDVSSFLTPIKPKARFNRRQKKAGNAFIDGEAELSGSEEEDDVENSQMDKGKSQCP